MAGKLFPEILIGDSEDTFKKPPTAKNPFGTRRGVRLTSPLSADEESHQSNSLADSVEKKELQEMGEEEEEEEEGEPHQDVPGNIMEDGCSGLTIKDVSGDGVQRELWTPFTSNTEEQLESRMSELGSFSHSFELEGKTTPPFSRLEPPENSHEDSESYCLLDEDSILSDSAVSTGYFPCYRTYVELPRYQPPRNAGSPPGDAEGRAGSSCDVSVQCSGWLEEDSTHPGTRASDMMQGSRDQDEALAEMTGIRVSKGLRRRNNRNVVQR
ncbi:uncharacterized protein LOC106732640 [Pelodiscus sinensis]|uniref:uncharacterized protein LOC106732640 n=1 Tax=Pelodiscus sinensis TaxID=13735 RepID=UPI003F6AFED5